MDRGYWKTFFVLLGAGVLGVLGLYPVLAPTAETLLEQPGAPDVPLQIMQLLLLINPLLLLVAGVAVGTAVAPRLGLRSHLADRARHGTPVLPGLRSEIAAAVAWGASAGVLIIGLDLLARPLMNDPAAASALSITGEPRSLAITLSGMLYGGITEELLVRWGVLSLFAWAGWRIFRRRRPAPGAGVIWAAILLSSLLFGAGHLGAVAVEFELTPMLTARTVILNAVGGIIFGWLFCRKSLEAAMIAHATAHVVFTAASWVG